MATRDKPFVEMSPSEFEEAFDEIGSDLKASILQEARETATGSFVMAAALLTLPDGTRKLAYPVMEYGDGDGVSAIDDFIGECTRTKALRSGETLRLWTHTFKCQQLLDDV